MILSQGNCHQLHRLILLNYEISPPKTSVRLFTSFLISLLHWNLVLKMICSALRTSNAHKEQSLQRDRFSNARAHFFCQGHSRLVCEGLCYIFNTNLVAPNPTILSPDMPRHKAVYQCTWQNKHIKAHPSKLHLLCFLYKEPNSIPKQLVLLNSSFKYSAACQKELCQVYKWQEIKTEKGKSKLGDSTQNIVLGWGVGRRQLRLTAKPLVFPRKQQEESRQPTPLPNTGPFHKFGGCCCGLQKEKERRLAHLVGFGNCLANLVSFPPWIKAGTGQVTVIKQDYRTGQVSVSWKEVGLSLWNCL